MKRELQGNALPDFPHLTTIRSADSNSITFGIGTFIPICQLRAHLGSTGCKNGPRNHGHIYSKVDSTTFPHKTVITGFVRPKYQSCAECPQSAKSPDNKSVKG